MSGNFFKDNKDLQFYFERGIDWATLVELTEHRFRCPGGPASVTEAVDLYRDIAELVGGYVAEEIAPYASEIDRQEMHVVEGDVAFPPRLKRVFDGIRDMEVHGLCVPRELGGMNAPLVLYFLLAELFARADVSVMTHHSFHGGMAMAMLVFSLREGTSRVNGETGEIEETRFRGAMEEILRGEAWGCMDITEPDAGSDMAALRAYGEQGDGGQWYVTGQKIFITSGHGKYHFVIARTEPAASPDDPFAGLKGLSMFLVPTYTTNADGSKTWHATIDRIEEKLGHHGSVTAQISFERSPAYLIGERGEGFSYMLTLMNNARLGVGFECIGLCEAAWRMASAYAAQRPSMGKMIDQHEMIADILDGMQTDIQALRALCVEGAYHEEVHQKAALALKFATVLRPDERSELEGLVRKHKAEARRLTPLLKFYGAERAVSMAQQCIQVHGGVGYTTEYGAEKLLRDAMVMPIYEGTSQIQALMAMKDTLMGALQRPADFVREQAEARWLSATSSDDLERRVFRLRLLRLRAVQHLLVRTAGDKVKGLKDLPLTAWPQRFLKDWNPKKDFAFAMLHAARLTQLLFDDAAAGLLWQQAQRHPDRREVLGRWLERAEPRARFCLDEILHTGDRLLAKLRHNEGSAPNA